MFLLCREYGLAIGLPKCKFAVKEIKFLGHCFTASGCSPLVKHSATISAFPQPTDKPSLWYSKVNFYRKFLCVAAQVIAPLTDALKGPGKTIPWTLLMDSAFIRAKHLLTSFQSWFRRLISSRLVWPGMSRDVGVWAKSCIPCQKSKISTHVHSTFPSIPVPTRRFAHVHVDIVGLLPSCQGHSYLLTMIDRTTRWPKVVPLSSISTEYCVCAFISTWISRF